MDKDRIRIEGIFHCFVDGVLYKKFRYTVRHANEFIIILRAQEGSPAFYYQPSAVLIMEAQIEKLARMLCEKDGTNADAEIEVMPGELRIYDKKSPFYSTWWIMI